MNKFEEFDAAHQAAVVQIKEFLKPSKYEPSMHRLVEWMMGTDANPYAYLAQEWGSSLSSAQSFSALLNMIHHALYDDGDISFVNVNGEHRIVFAHPTDSNFREQVLTEQEQDMESDPYWFNAAPYEITVLDITPAEFGPLYNKYQTEDVRRCFTLDAAAHGVEWAAEHYREYQCWDESWATEFKAQEQNHE